MLWEVTEPQASPDGSFDVKILTTSSTTTTQ